MGAGRVPAFVGGGVVLPVGYFGDPMMDEILQAASERHRIPEPLLRAIVMVESGGDTWAVRYEPGYRWLWDVRDGKPYRGTADAIPAPRGVSRPTELKSQRTSWGLMQVMGATARELGFRGKFLSQLCDPEFGVEYGCKYLLRLRSRFGQTGWEPVVVAYNAGSPRRRDDGSWVNQDYIDKVVQAGWRPPTKTRMV